MRETISHFVDVIQNEIEGITEPCQFGIPVFDGMSPNARLAVLAEVGTGLLCRSKTCPLLTAINESMIAAIFHHLSDWIQYELDCEEDFEDMVNDNPYFWRELALAAFAEFANDELPDRSCRDDDEWELIIEGLSDRILWDNDFNSVGAFLDTEPDKAEEMRDKMGIDDSYYRAVPPDPKEADIPVMLAKLKDLCSE